MGIPLEEVNSIKANLKHMKEKVGRLQETKDSKLDTYNKYCEDCVRSREEKQAELKMLKELISNEKATREQYIADAREAGFSDTEQLDKDHAEMTEMLKKKIEKLDKELEQVKKQSRVEEANQRKEFKKAAVELVANT